MMPPRTQPADKRNPKGQKVPKYQPRTIEYMGPLIQGTSALSQPKLYLTVSRNTGTFIQTLKD